ncbi:hypothetical protein [Streptomyces sp. NPDC057694]|uniref:hypothetical protein n=1 Tax=unclassified Streptomyces TaxID=2593676 RepID=UPI0036A10073
MPKADTDWMRRRADDVDAVAQQVKKQLGVADDAEGELRAGAAGWAFLDGLGQLEERWEDLNKLLRDELDKAAENIRFNAGSYDGNENFLTELWHDITN